MKILNNQMEFIPQSPTVAMADRVNSLISQGNPIIGLQTGDPDYATHQSIMKVAMKSMQKGLTHYGPSRGFIDFRRAAANKLMRDNHVEYDPEAEIMATHGGIHAFYTAMQAILNPGDEVLIPDPTWATHANMVTLLRGIAIRVSAPVENGFLPTYTEWEKMLSPRTKIIVINYPSNPTGVYPSREYMQFLQDFAEANHLWVVSDEVYENLYYGEHPVCASDFPGAKGRTILINSLSKTYAMTGWRVGYLAAPKEVIDNSLKAGQISITCVAPFIQKAAGFALSDPAIQKYATEMRNGYSRRREIVLNAARELSPTKIKVIAPMGAFYFFLDMRELKRGSIEICEQILDQAGVGLVAGAAFGKNGEGFVRMTIAASDENVNVGFRKIINWAENQN